MSMFIQSANIQLQKKQPSYFFGLRLIFPNLQTNASTNHDGSAEPASHFPQQHQQDANDKNNDHKENKVSPISRANLIVAAFSCQMMP